MNKNTQTVLPGGHLRGNFNKILAFVGFGWLLSMVAVRYVIKPYKVEARMKENQDLMNSLYEEQLKQEKMKQEEEFKI